jgi:CheY-like chemotaxis protein/two-component sensor histidine kinase
VEDLLDVTRISQGKIILKREKVDLNALGRNTVEDHRGVYVGNGVELRIEPADGPLWVDGDLARLAQVLGNLLHNSAKFTPRGGTAVLSLKSDNSGHAVVQMSDTGAGMSAATLQHLFEPFVQGPQSIDRSRGGLGLGLALVKGLVEMHGGSVEARSEGEGKGAELTLKLPLQSPAQPLPPVAPPPPPRGSGRLRVLVIEDNEDAAQSLKTLLELWRHEALIAYSGSQGIQLAREAKADLVICDIGLPHIDGYGVAEVLRADPDAEIRSMFLVALTGYSRPEDVARSKKAGFDHHLVKPLSIGAIETLLAEATARSSVHNGPVD